MKIRKVVKFICIIVALILFIGAGSFLVVNEKPIKSDVIIALGGDTNIRTDYSVRLFKEKYSNKLLFTGGIIDSNTNDIEAIMMQDRALELGISKKNIILESEALNTYDNAVNCKEILKAHGYKSAIIVTSNYHMRRAELVFKKVFEDTNIKLTFCSVKDYVYNPTLWFLHWSSIKIVFSEYLKLIGYFVKGRVV